MFCILFVISESRIHSQTTTNSSAVLRYAPKLSRIALCNRLGRQARSGQGASSRTAPDLRWKREVLPMGWEQDGHRRECAVFLPVVRQSRRKTWRTAMKKVML